MVRSMWLSSRWSCSFGNDPTILTVVGWTGVASAALTFIHSAMVGLMKRLTDINWGGATLVGARLHRSNFGVCGCGITRDTHIFTRVQNQLWRPIKMVNNVNVKLRKMLSFKCAQTLTLLVLNT